VTRKAGDNEVVLGEEHVIFVAECARQAVHKIEQAIAAGSNMCAVLDVTLRPELLRRELVALIEQRIESLQH
jgi:hypothetical protein